MRQFLLVLSFVFTALHPSFSTDACPWTDAQKKRFTEYYDEAIYLKKVFEQGEKALQEKDPIKLTDALMCFIGMHEEFICKHKKMIYSKMPDIVKKNCGDYWHLLDKGHWNQIGCVNSPDQPFLLRVGRRGVVTINSLMTNAEICKETFYELYHFCRLQSLFLAHMDEDGINANAFMEKVTDDQGRFKNNNTLAAQAIESYLLEMERRRATEKLIGFPDSAGTSQQSAQTAIGARMLKTLAKNRAEERKQKAASAFLEWAPTSGDLEEKVQVSILAEAEALLIEGHRVCDEHFSTAAFSSVWLTGNPQKRFADGSDFCASMGIGPEILLYSLWVNWANAEMFRMVLENLPSTLQMFKKNLTPKTLKDASGAQAASAKKKKKKKKGGDHVSNPDAAQGNVPMAAAPVTVGGTGADTGSKEPQHVDVARANPDDSGDEGDCSPPPVQVDKDNEIPEDASIAEDRDLVVQVEAKDHPKPSEQKPAKNKKKEKKKKKDPSVSKPAVVAKVPVVVELTPLERAMAELEEMRSEKAAVDAKNRELQEQLEASQAASQILEDQLREMKKKENERKKEFRRSISLREVVEGKLEKEAKAKKNLQKLLGRTESQRDLLQGEKEALVKKLGETEAQLKALKGELDKKEVELNDIRSESDLKQKELVAGQNNLERLMGLQAAGYTYDRANLIAQVQRDVSALMLYNHDLQQRLSLTERDFVSMRSSYLGLVDEAKNHQLTLEIRAARGEIAQLKGMIESLTRGKDGNVPVDVHVFLNEKAACMAKLEVELAESNAFVDKLKSELEKLKDAQEKQK